MKQILIVEDDNLLNKTLAYNLASDDYAITNVLNARAAAILDFAANGRFTNTNSGTEWNYFCQQS